MNSLDAIHMNFAAQMKAAIDSGDQDALAGAIAGLAEDAKQQVLKEVRATGDTRDVSILAARGVRQLTSEESSYYQRLAEAMKSSNPKQALTDLDVVLPQTVLDWVFEDLQKRHPLLSMIRFQSTEVLVKILVNKNPRQLATWGDLVGPITKELESGFAEMDTTMYKLSAWMPVDTAMLDLGPTWLDRYVRIVIAEALAFGLENAIVAGTGVKMPVGMRKDNGGGSFFSPTTGWPDKTPIAITDLSPETVGQLLSTLATDENGYDRTLSEVALIVNPKDYYNKVFPATTVLGTDGTYRKDVLPYPMTVVQSVEVGEGEAIIGLPKLYFTCMGSGRDGKIEFSDHYKFLEHQRIYRVVLYGNGMPLDNNAFLLLDISGLEPANIRVQVVNADDFPTI